jgi:nicotinate dehydrogenase subunit B
MWAPKFTVAHDCGLIINPNGLERCIEGNVVQGTSRALAEEVAFDRAKVTSVDWLSYPILDITEAPEAIDIVLDQPPRAAAGRSRRELDPPGRRSGDQHLRSRRTCVVPHPNVLSRHPQHGRDRRARISPVPHQHP